MTRIACCILLVASVSATGLAGRQEKKAPAPSKIDLNLASEADLTKLPGVDAAVAKRIVAGRPYTSVAELSRIGLSKTAIDTIAPLAVAHAPKAPGGGPPTPPPGPPPGPPGALPPGARGASPSAPPGATVNLNTASEKELASLPGIDAPSAKRIVAARPYASVAELSKAGVAKSTIDRIAPLVSAGAMAPPGAISGPPLTSGPPGASDSGYRMGPPVPGIVWVSNATRLYYKPGDLRIGKASEGDWMLEGDAIKKGFRAAPPKQ